MNSAHFVVGALLLFVAGCSNGDGSKAHRAVFLDYLMALEARDESALRRVVFPDDIHRWEVAAPGLFRQLVISGELGFPLDFSTVQKRKISIEEFAEDSPNHYQIIFLVPTQNEPPTRYHLSVVNIDGRSFVRLPIPEKR